MNRNILEQLDGIYKAFANMFIAAPIVRSIHSYYPVLNQSGIDLNAEMSFVIFAGKNVEDLATSCYHHFTQDKKIGMLYNHNELVEAIRHKSYLTNSKILTHYPFGEFLFWRIAFHPSEIE